ncbi:hypothetical protein BDC45DRAFT_528169 [Circinella umbellata]|nr:hypothetical protein BDC45DRAFT_528169 [Circinella umbellata]
MRAFFVFLGRPLVITSLGSSMSLVLVGSKRVSSIKSLILDNRSYFCWSDSISKIALCSFCSTMLSCSIRIALELYVFLNVSMYLNVNISI